MSSPLGRSQVRMGQAWDDLMFKILRQNFIGGFLPNCSGSSSANTNLSVLTVDDCFELGRVAYSEADYYHTELWMLQALRQLEQGEPPGVVDAVTILDHLSYSVYQQGELERALDFTKKLLELGQ